MWIKWIDSGKINEFQEKLNKDRNDRKSYRLIGFRNFIIFQYFFCSTYFYYQCEEILNCSSFDCFLVKYRFDLTFLSYFLLGYSYCRKFQFWVSNLRNFELGKFRYHLHWHLNIVQRISDNILHFHIGIMNWRPDRLNIIQVILLHRIVVRFARNDGHYFRF